LISIFFLPTITFFILIFFLLIIPPPPRSTLFPYTTLFRSMSIEVVAGLVTGILAGSFALLAFSGDSFIELISGLAVLRFLRRRRSEEHTSELQSRFDLVCRLLLEKKKKKQKYKNTQKNNK